MGIRFAGKWLFFYFGRCCRPGGGFLVTLAIFLIKRQIARDHILYDKTALKLSCGANDDQLLYMLVE